MYLMHQGILSSVQSQLCPTFASPWTVACQPSLSITNSWSLFKLMSIESSNHLILCHPLLLLPSIFPSIRIFSNESILHIRCPKYWFQLQHQSFQWIFRTNFLSDGLLGSPCSPSDSQESSTTQCKRISSLHQVAKVLEFQLQHQSFQWIFRTDFP